MDTCDPNAEIADLRKLIKMNTGHSIKLTREQICQVYDDIQGGKLPLPPLVLDSKMSYLIDKKSPLTPKDFDVLFDSSSKRTDLKRIARKVGLVKTEQMTKNQIFDAIGKRLRYMNVHEPIKISRKRLLSSKSNTAANNAAVNNLGLNNAAANNAAANNLGLNNTGNSGNNLGLNNTGNTGFNNTGNNVNRNRNFNNNSAFNSGGGSNNLSNNASSKPNSKVSFPNKSLFATMNKPDFAKNQENMSRPKPMFTGMMGSKTPNFINSNKKKTSFFGGLFGGSKNNNKNKNFIKANKFNKAKPGFVFKTGNQGLGYYKNEGPVVAQGPLKKPNGFGEPVGPNNKPNKPVNKPNKPVNNKNNKVNTGVGNNTVNNKNNKNNKVNTGVGNNTVNNKNNKVNIGVGNNTVNNKNNKVNIGVGNNTVNNKNNKPVNNKPNKVNIGVGNNTVNNKNNNGNTIMTNANANNKNNNGNTIMTNANANNKNNNGNTIMTNANNNTKPNSNVKPNNNTNNQARRNEENRKKAEKEAQEAKKEAAREELRKRQEEIKKKREETKRVANIEKNLLKLPNVDKVYLTAFRGNKSVENVNKNALLNKVAKDKIIRNLRNEVSPMFMGKRRIAYVNPTNYNAMKKEVENKLAEKTASEADLQLLTKLSTNLAISKNYVKAFANGKAMNTISVNALTNKRNKDLEVYKLNATNKKGIFGGYSTTVPGTKTMKFIPNAEYNKTLNRAKTALEARRNAKQLAENKRKPKPNNNAKPNGNVKPNNNANNTKPNGNVKPNNNANNTKPNGNVKPNNNANNTKPNGNVKPNNNANNTKPNGNVKPNNNANNAKPNGNVKPNNAEFMGPNNKLNTIEEEPNKENASGNNFKNASNNTFKLNKNTKNKIQNNNNFNASAELNKQLNNEAKRQNRAKNKNNNNFNAAAELNKQLNNEGKRINRAAKNNNNNFNAAAELNKQLNNEGKRQQNVENKKLANRRKNLTNKTEREVAKFMGRIGKWRPAIINAKTITELNNLNKNLNNRIKLRNNIKKSVLTRKEQSEYANMVMKLNKKVANTRKLFENGVNKKISNTTGPLVKGILNKAVANNKRGSFNGGERLGNNNNNIINGKPKPVYNNSNSNSNNNVNNKKKMRLGGRAAEQNMKPNPIFEPNMKNNPTFEVFENKKPNNKPKITNENLRPMKSAIGGLKQLPKNKKSGFESRLNAAFKNQNLNKMKAIRNEAIAANKTIQNQLAEEKRLKEEAKEAQRKKEAENAARRKAEREAKKKAANEEAKKKVANNMKRQLNAANNILNLANKALKKKENNKAPTLMERGSYTSKINTQMKKLAKGTTNRVREDWEKKKRTFKGRITRAATIGQVKKAYENAKEEYNKLK
jgi:hypothetical protein